MKKKLITIRNLWKSYGELVVLKGLDLDIYEGETLVILGRSGVGKSVLLKQIIGLETPDEGEVTIDGVSIAKKKEERPTKGQKTMGMLFQGAALFDSMTVAENTAFYLTQNMPEMSREEIEQNVDQALQMVGLEEAKEKMPSELSGGMKKRAAIARLAAYHPSIILYDEPTTGLDPITAMQINHLIVKTQQQLKATSVVVTHDIRSALEVGDRLAFHHDGKILYIEPRDAFMEIEDPLLQAFFNNALIDRNTKNSSRSNQHG